MYRGPLCKEFDNLSGTGIFRLASTILAIRCAIYILVANDYDQC